MYDYQKITLDKRDATSASNIKNITDIKNIAYAQHVLNTDHNIMENYKLLKIFYK
jgi:hypothetical protein